MNAKSEYFGLLTSAPNSSRRELGGISIFFALAIVVIIIIAEFVYTK
jgi:hypothetical protein